MNFAFETKILFIETLFYTVINKLKKKKKHLRISFFLMINIAFLNV